jgi:cytoskeletal protein CcmA (bactofilin family)
MLNKNGLFGKKEEGTRPELTRSPYSSQPTASTAAQPAQPVIQRTETTVKETASAPAPEESKSKLIVGPNIKLKGVEITDCDTLVVEGRVEATMDSRVIQVAEHGSFTGTVGIDIAEIRGRFEGELTARQRLVIYSTGSVSGKIRYGKIVIEEGGVLSGDCASSATEVAAARPALTDTAASDRGEKKGNDLWVASDSDKAKAALAR